MTDFQRQSDDGTSYDFGDPEYWESYGANPDGALLFAKGFPAYWKAVAGWYAKQDWLEELAVFYRNRAVWAFAGDESRTPFIVLEALGLKSLPLRFEHLRPYLTCYSEDALKYEAEFADPNRCQPPSDHALLPFIIMTYCHLDNCTTEWNAIARTYVDALQSAGVRPKALPPGPKRRERLPDGAVFVGRIRLAHQEVLQQELVRNAEKCVRWGPLLYQPHLAQERHFLVMGMPRSGKTTLLRLLLQSLHRMDDARVVVYDFKNELLPGLNPSPQQPVTDSYHIINPYDARGSAWDIAKDVDENSASTLAQILIPQRATTTACTSSAFPERF